MRQNGVEIGQSANDCTALQILTPREFLN